MPDVGLYGDLIADMQWMVRQLLDTLDNTGLRDNTLILFASDHGPEEEAGLEGGATGMFKGNVSEDC